MLFKTITRLLIKSSRLELLYPTLTMTISCLLLSLLACRITSSTTYGNPDLNNRLSTKNARLRRTRGKGGKGKGSTSTFDDFTLPLLEDVSEPSGSNDGSHLEHICSLFAESGSILAGFQGSCDDFDRFKDLMCPDEYEIGKICDSRAQYSDIQEAIEDEYCGPLFSPLNEVPVDEQTCADLCKSFVLEWNCCNLSCATRYF